MSANNVLVADAAAFCAKQKEAGSEKRFRQVAPSRDRGPGLVVVVSALRADSEPQARRYSKSGHYPSRAGCPAGRFKCQFAPASTRSGEWMK